MITAAAAPVDNVSNATAAWVVLALLAVFAICATLWHHERISDRQTARIDTHDEQLAELAYQMPVLLDWLGIEIPAPVSDDSPEAMAMTYGHDCDHTSLQHGADGCNVPGCLCAYMSWNESDYDEPATDEIPVVQPETEPMAVVDPTPAVQARRDAAWDEQRPSPVPRKSADWVEDAIKGFNFEGGRR